MTFLPSFIGGSRTRYTIDDIFFVCRLRMYANWNSARKKYGRRILPRYRLSWNPRTLHFSTTTCIVSIRFPTFYHEKERELFAIFAYTFILIVGKTSNKFSTIRNKIHLCRDAEMTITEQFKTLRYLT